MAVTVAAIAEAVWQRTLHRQPLARLRQGLPVTSIPTGSLDEAMDDAAAARHALAQLDEADPKDDQLTADFLRALLTTELGAAERWWWHFPVTPYQLYTLTVVVPQVLPAASDRAGVLGSCAAAMRVAGAKLDAQGDRGWRVPEPALEGVRSTLAALRSGPLAEHGGFVEALDALAAKVERHAEKAPPTVGLSQYPGGAEAYAGLVRLHATFDITPEEVHRIGVDDVAALTERMAEVQQRIGIDGGEEEIRAHLRKVGVLHATTPDDVEARYRQAISRIEPVLGDAFAVLPSTPYDIERLDPALEAAMTYGYYEFPTPAKPIGSYRYNGSGLETRSQVNAAALIYHELVPGHHFHIARQSENEALPAIRRDSTSGIGMLTAYAEGWAEYAAHVAGELGMYSDPLDEYGRLTHERFMAARLVLDSGMNAMGWPLDEARAYMRRYTLESDTQVATDTLRYSTDLPGQAIAYRLGDLKLRGLRDRAGLGAKEFHELVLGPGALQLDVLANHVDRTIGRTNEGIS